MSERLSEQIASILCTAPTSLDPEDDVNEDTTARVDSIKGDVFSDNDEKDQNFTNFRKKNIDFLEDVDKRYKGKKASRKRSASESWESVSEDSFDERKSNESDENNDSVETESYSEDDSAVSNDFDIRKDDSFEHLLNNASNELAKGTCVRNQLCIWENFLEIRIQLQKFLEGANAVVHNTEYRNLQFLPKVDAARNIIANLLDKFLNLQMLLLKQYPETKNLLNNINRKLKSSEDEEFEGNVPTKKVKLSEYELEVSKRYSLYKQYGVAVIQKWNNKTQLANNKFGNADNSIIKQIEHVLSDKEKLIKRTQLKRTNYDRLGQASTSNVQNNGKEYDPEIFDDTDFYHHLLRELIEYKSATITDPVQLSRQWIQLQNLRSKMKKKVDTKATKGRKIRYTVHSKLVNFMAPIDNCKWEKEAESELYNSLFAKNQSINKL